MQQLCSVYIVSFFSVSNFNLIEVSINLYFYNYSNLFIILHKIIQHLLQRKHLLFRFKHNHDFYFFFFVEEGNDWCHCLPISESIGRDNLDLGSHLTDNTCVFFQFYIISIFKWWHYLFHRYTSNDKYRHKKLFDR